jgi:hypothetical protein
MRGLIADTSGRAVFAALVIGFAGYKWVRGEVMTDFQETMTTLVVTYYFAAAAIEANQKHQAQPVPLVDLDAVDLLRKERVGA